MEKPPPVCPVCDGIGYVDLGNGPRTCHYCIGSARIRKADAEYHLTVAGTDANEVQLVTSALMEKASVTKIKNHTILLLSADPSNVARLRLDQEFRDIREKLQLAKDRARFSLETRTSVRSGDLIQAILDVEPQIVHFSGHGTSSGELCLENALGEIQKVSPDALASLFELVANHVQCVILNACYSEIQAEAIAKHIGYVIGMERMIGDEAAIAFATGFYRALGAGRSVEEAYKFGIVELKMLNIPEHLTPILIRTKPNAQLLALPADIDLYFCPSGWMGDGEAGEKYLRFERLEDCIRITYMPGPKGWAGIYWQYPEHNWGSIPGRSLINVRKLVFWAKGNTGNEVVEFKIGGVQGRYEDSLKRAVGKLKLSRDWKRYDVDLSVEDLSNVIGAFAWIAEGKDNPTGLTFYLKEIYLEK